MQKYKKIWKVSKNKNSSVNMTKETDEKIVKFEEEISNFFEDLMYEYGGSPLLGRIYGLCVIKANESVFQKDLQDIFKVNPSTISRNLKELESWNLITKRREPGSREWKYQLNETSFLELFLHNFEETKIKLDDKHEELIRIKNHWFRTELGEDLKETEVFHQLNTLIDWINVVEIELDSFIANVNKKYLELENKKY